MSPRQGPSQLCAGTRWGHLGWVLCLKVAWQGGAILGCCLMLRKEARAAPLYLGFGRLLTQWRRVLGWFLAQTVHFLKKLERHCHGPIPRLQIGEAKMDQPAIEIKNRS